MTPKQIEHLQGTSIKIQEQRKCKSMLAHKPFKAQAGYQSQLQSHAEQASSPYRTQMSRYEIQVQPGEMLTRSTSVVNPVNHVYLMYGNEYI